MKFPLFALALTFAFGLAAPADAQDVQFNDAKAQMLRGQCLLQRAREMRGEASWPLLAEAEASFNAALGDVAVTSPEPGRYIYISSHTGLRVIETVRADPDFARGTPSFTARTSCETAVS